MKYWYILLVKQGYEQFILNQLKEKEDDLMVDELKINKKLSGYIFIRSIEISKQQAVEFLSFEGVIKFLGMKKNGPKKFSNSQIKTLNKEEKQESEIKFFKIGDYVIIKQGDLSGIEGYILEIKKRIVKIKSIFFQKVIKIKLRDIELL